MRGCSLNFGDVKCAISLCQVWQPPKPLSARSIFLSAAVAHRLADWCRGRLRNRSTTRLLKFWRATGTQLRLRRSAISPVCLLALPRYE